MEGSKRIWVWVGIVVIIIVVVFAFVWKPAPSQPASSGRAPVYAPQGQLTPNFPKELILDPQAQVNSSYSINYDASTNQYTAEWVSSSSLATLYNNYKTYFGNNGWAIANASGATSASKIGAMYATTSTAKVNVTFLAQGKGTGVSISYVAY
jgi:hypothetical protein